MVVKDEKAGWEEVSETKETVLTKHQTVESVGIGELVESGQLHRSLGNRQIQLIAIGGSIGTATFVSISSGLIKGGPGSLFLAYTIYSCMVGLANNCMAEMAVWHPVSGAFIRMADHWVDPAFGFMAGWNFWIYEAINIPFEISAINLVLTFWRDDIPVAAVVATCIVLYFLINVFAVRWYGEAEFWLSTGKVFLILIVFSFTFVTMVGGNPKHDAYGFRYWDDPGAFATYIAKGDLGRFEGFLGCLWLAAFTIVGPEYVSMVAGETKHPRQYLKTAFKTTYARFAFFFIGSALCVGIVIPYNDPTLLAILTGESGGAGTASASPYVIACYNLGISGLPHVVNALLITSIFSAGNAYTYCGTRSLYGLAQEGQAPKIFGKCTASGVPIYALCLTMLFPFLAFLNVSGNGVQVLSWFTNIITAAGIIDYIVICVTYIFFYRACKAQKVERRSLPYYGYFQPYCAWIGVCWFTTVVFVYGYTVFLPGMWSIKDFFTYYTMVIVTPCLYLGWKIVKRTKFIKPEEADLVWDRPAVDAYEMNFVDGTRGFWTEIVMMFGFHRGRRESIA